MAVEIPNGTRRILSIDGGGIKGVFPAAFLATLESGLKKPIGSYFDLIAGTSTGGILAIGLALGMRAETLLKLYEDRGSKIFGQDQGAVVTSVFRKMRAGRQFFTNKYNSNTLKMTLRKTFGDRRIGDAKTRLMVPAWDSIARSVYIYKTAHHLRLQHDYRCTVIDAAMATSAAPTYFQQHETEQLIGLTDGGVWANNPTGLAVVEAIAVLGWSSESLRVLSLGCTNEAYTIPKRAGLARLGSRGISLFIDGQSAGSLGVAKLLSGHEHERTAIYRINHTASMGTFKLDDTSSIGKLKGLGYSLARDRAPVLEPVFFQTPAEAFHPLHQIDDSN